VDIIVAPHPYSRAFDEVAETIRCGLAQLASAGFTLPDRQIIINAHTLSPDTRLDERAILYNFEQRGSPQLSEATLSLFRRHEVWDYSPSNVAWLAERDVRAKHVPIGYTPELTRIIDRAPPPDIDVLFYGLVNNRRRVILDGLRAAGVNVCDAYALHGRAIYGIERDSLIGRSKIVLNVHYYDSHDTRIFEIVRCSYLFANAVCVVSEESWDMPHELHGVVPLVPYDQLVGFCIELLSAPEARHNLAIDAHDTFRRCLEWQILKKALTT
jgi:hypothetical protein